MVSHKEMDRDQVITRIRLNIAFERMVVAVLAGAFASAVALFVLTVLALLFGGGLRVQSVAYGIYEAGFFGSIVFLSGFLASAGLGLPLFNFLETRKVRKIWPYVMLALCVQYVVISVIKGQALTIADFTSLTSFSLFVPVPVILWVFSKEIRPLWKASQAQPVVNSSLH